MGALSSSQMVELGRFADAGDRDGYYRYLEQAGDKYAELAGGVVREDTMAGRMANAFMSEQAQQQGKKITQCGAKKISEELMRADYDARVQTNGETLDFAAIRRYHEQVFYDNGLTRDAWTATAPLDVIGDHYKFMGYESKYEAQDAIWNAMLNHGIRGQSATYFVMEKFSYPDGIFLDYPDGFPTDPRATKWHRTINTTSAKNPVYLADDFNPGTRYPFPPCTPEELATTKARSRVPSSKGKDAIRDNGKNGQIVCLSPDVCLTKVGKSIVPIPYMIVSKLSWCEKTVTNTTFGGLEAFTMESRTNKVKGDERGKYGGVKSGVNKGWCRPQTNKSSFFVKGNQVIHHDHVYEMNCAGPNGPSDTVGKIRFVEEWKADDKPL